MSIYELPICLVITIFIFSFVSTCLSVLSIYLCKCLSVSTRFHFLYHLFSIHISIYSCIYLYLPLSACLSQYLCICLQHPKREDFKLTWISFISFKLQNFPGDRLCTLIFTAFTHESCRDALDVGAGEAGWQGTTGDEGFSKQGMRRYKGHGT